MVSFLSQSGLKICVFLLSQKLEGANYMQIHEAGGGIHFTVTHTKNATEEQLYKSLKERLDSFLSAGILQFNF